MTRSLRRWDRSTSPFRVGYPEWYPGCSQVIAHGVGIDYHMGSRASGAEITATDGTRRYAKARAATAGGLATGMDKTVGHLTWRVLHCKYNRKEKKSNYYLLPLQDRRS